jgi:hypothetical protein
MKRNVGNGDRAVRLVFAFVVGVLFLSGEITGLAAIILGSLAAIFVLTGLVGFCPLYVPIRISTVPKSLRTKRP